MKLTQQMSEFNRRLADQLRETFAPNVLPYQAEDGSLLFRGPIDGHRDPKHQGTHVSVELDGEVRAALDGASAEAREEMIENLLASLGSQVRTQYHPQRIGPYALQVHGTMRTLKG